MAPKTETVSSLFFFSGLVTAILMCTFNFWQSGPLFIAYTIGVFVLFLVITFRVKRGDRAFFVIGCVLNVKLFLFHLGIFSAGPHIFSLTISLIYFLILVLALIQIKSFWKFSGEKNEERNKQGLY